MGLSTRRLKLVSLAALVALVAGTTTGCGGGGRSGTSRSETKVVPVVPVEPAREAYRPPPDARLRPDQIELYLAVWKSIPPPKPVTSSTYPERSKGLGDAVDGVAPDIAAARAMKASVEEYLWVKERILEAEAARMTARLDADVLEMLERTLADLRVTRTKASDEGSRTLLSEQIANFEAEAARTRREAREKEPESVRANLHILEPYRARLDALQDQIDSVLPAAGGSPKLRKTPLAKKRGN